MKPDLYRGFKKVQEDNRTATMAHPNGHKLQIMKENLSPKLRRQLSSLPLHQAEGSAEPVQAPEEIQAPPQAADNAAVPDNSKPVNIVINNAQPHPVSPVDAVGNTPQDVGGNMAAIRQAREGEAALTQKNEMMKAQQEEAAKSRAMQTAARVAPNALGSPTPTPSAPEAPAAPEPAPTLAPAPAPTDQDPFGEKAYEGMVTGGINKQISGEYTKAAVEKQRGDQAATLLNDQIQQQQAQAWQYQNSVAGLEGERQKFMKDIADNHIDPQHYMHERGTQGRVMTGIGILLGGMGAGIAHEAKNPVLEQMNLQIDRDINAQMQNMGARKSLLEANLKQFGNLKDATDMTRVMMGDILANQIKGVAAKTQGALAKAEADKAAGAIMTTNAELVKGIATRKMLLKAMGQGGGGGSAQAGAPAQPGQYESQMLNQLDILDPKRAEALRKRFVPGFSGFADVDVPEKVRDKIEAQQNFDEKMQKLRDFAKRNQGTVINRAIVEEGKVLAKEAQGAYRVKSQGGVFKESEKKFIDSMIPDDPTEFMSAIRTDPQYRTVQESNRKELNNTLKNIGIKPAQAPADIQAQSFVDYAKKNAKSKDPKVQARVQFINKKYGSN